MKIDTWWGAVVFATAAALVGAVGAVGLALLTTPQEQHVGAAARAFWSVMIVAFPILLFVAAKIKENTALNAALRRLAEHDRLTDLATREHFFGQLRARPQSTGVVLMIDIDHFKSVNDGHGHLAGDHVLRTVAGELRGQLREKDLLARFGGEEFIAFLADVDPDHGLAIANRLRATIAATQIDYEGAQIPVTVSIGMSLQAKAPRIEAAIKQADEALYAAKRGGRNCVMQAHKRHAGPSLSVVVAA